jgi:hypothetical protein
MAISRLSDASIQDGLPKFDNLWDGKTATSSIDTLGVVAVGSAGAATVEFTSIPSTYTHLQIRFIARKNGSLNDTTNILMNFNGSSSAVYNDHYLLGNGSDASASGSSGSVTRIASIYFAGGGMTANTFGAGVIDILDYANTNKYKTTRQLSGVSSNAGSTIDYILFGSGVYNQTSAISSITLTGSNFVQHSFFALYGIK